MIPAEGRFFASRSDMLGLIVCRVDVGLAATDGEVRSLQGRAGCRLRWFGLSQRGGGSRQQRPHRNLRILLLHSLRWVAYRQGT